MINPHSKTLVSRANIPAVLKSILSDNRFIFQIGKRLVEVNADGTAVGGKQCVIFDSTVRRAPARQRSRRRTDLVPGRRVIHINAIMATPAYEYVTIHSRGNRGSWRVIDSDGAIKQVMALFLFESRADAYNRFAPILDFLTAAPKRSIATSQSNTEIRP